MVVKTCPKCKEKIAPAFKCCPHCKHQFYVKQKSKKNKYTPLAADQNNNDGKAALMLGSVLRFRQNGQVIGYSRHMRAIKPTSFFGCDGSDFKENLDPKLRAGQKLISPDLPSPVVPVMELNDVPRTRLSPKKKRRGRWHLPKTDAERKRIQEEEKYFYNHLPLDIKRRFAQELQVINAKLCRRL